MMLGMDNHIPSRDGRDHNILAGGPPPYMPPTTGASLAGGGGGGAMPPFPPGGYGPYGHYPPAAAFPWNFVQGPGGAQMVPPEMAGVYDPTPVSPPPQRERFSYTRYQLELLNGIYESIRYPNSMQKQLIAKRVGITRDQVKIWFQNRRRKDVVENKNPTKPKKCVSGSDSDDLDGLRMVPPPILLGMVSELLKYENDPKGKKAIEAMKRAADGEGEGARKGGKKRKVEEDVKTEEPCVKNSIMGTAGSKVPSLECTLNTEGLLLQISPSSVYSPLSSTDHNTSVPSTASLSSPEGVETSPVTAASVTLPSIPAPTSTQVPSSEQLDMESPPNVVAPTPAGYCGTALTRSPSEDSICEINSSVTDAETSLANTSQNSESSRDFVPPNKMAPAVTSVNQTKLDLAPLSVHIPGAEKTTSTTVSANNPYHSTQGLVGMGYWNNNSSQKQDEYPQYARDNPYITFPTVTKTPASEQEVMAFTYALSKTAEKAQDSWHYPQCAEKSDPSKVFPFPITAETAQFLPPMTSSYTQGCGHNVPYMDPYQQPSVITSYNNPYYCYDAGAWANNQQEDKAKTHS